jgi:hypothetical protein
VRQVGLELVKIPLSDVLDPDQSARHYDLLSVVKQEYARGPRRLDPVDTKLALASELVDPIADLRIGAQHTVIIE